MHAAKPLAALALTGIGSALIVGFQVPAATVTTAATGGATTTTAAAKAPTSASTASQAPTTATVTASATPAATDPGSSAVTTATAAQYADGTYVGTAIEEPWGTFQVQAVVSGGVVTDVVVVSAPTDGHSSRINSQVVPALTQAALAAQSADIDMISGATWTSSSYTTSLQAALDAARAAAETAA